MGYEQNGERGFAFAPAPNLAGSGQVVPLRPSARAVFASTGVRPAACVLSESAPGLDMRLHSLFGLYARVRSFASIKSFGSALGSAKRRREPIAVVVVGDIARRRALPRFLEFVSDTSGSTSVDTIFFGRTESLVFHGRELVDVFSGFPEDLDRRVISTIRSSIERFYDQAAA